MSSSEPKADWWTESDFGVKVRQAIKAKLLHEERTDFQHLLLFEHETLGKVLVLDDIIQTTTSDEFIYHEMYVDVPLLGHPDFGKEGRESKVLIIGGGDGGLLREVLKHPEVSRVVMVEIDGKVVWLCKEFLGFNGDYEDPRVELVIGDGADYVRDCQPESFDFALIDSTDPGGPSEILYTEEFHRRVKALLIPSGTMVRHLGIFHFQGPVYRPVLRQIREVFPRAELYRATIPSYVGGDMAFVAATKDGHSCRRPYADRTGRYYSREVHEASFVLPPCWEASLDPSP